MRCLALFVLLFAVLGVKPAHSSPPTLDYRAPQVCEAIVDQNRANPYAYIFRRHCRRIHSNHIQSRARTLGNPQPSLDVLDVPAYRSQASRRFGISCLDGLVFIRIENGWTQALDDDNRYYRCREK